MENEKRTKWEIGVAISKGKQSVSLLETYLKAVEPRLKPDEAVQHRANVAELEKRRSGQPEALVEQKSKTVGQDSAITELHDCVISIRNIVKSSNAPAAISKAYGVGEKVPPTVSGIMAASNMIVNAYNANAEWSNNAGIIEADMEEMATLQEVLGTADSVQESSKFTRKSKTMDKNTLQRAVEDEVTKISAVGVHVFAKKDPAVAALFAGLIPGSGGTAQPPADNNTPKS